VTSVLGIHHVTAIASDPQRNLDFYMRLLGLRLVKRTVNFDDPETYHLYFGDDVGNPGSIMTFFPWPGAKPGRQGTGQVAVTSFAVLPRALGFWVERLVRHGIKYEGPTKQVISFTDPDGLMLEIVADAGAEARPAWGDAPGIAREQAIHGFHSVTLWAEQGDDTERVLVDTLGFHPVREDDTTRRFAAGDGGPGTLVNVRSVGGFVRGAGGAGTVHHVAWRVADDTVQLQVRQEVTKAGMQPTPVIDRQYFHSVYFREPGGVLFELATDPPGFAIDEPVAHLGERLMLPRQYEAQRAEIEAILPPIHLPIPASEATLRTSTGPEDVSGDALGFIHRYLPPTAGAELAGSTTLLLLHGTGGDEEDLIPLGRSLLPGAGLLSPRGKVLERGAPRFFRRLAEGVFDQEDLARRTDELAQFIEAAAKTYQLDRDGIVAVGFSNGANIAASLLLRRPGLVRRAVLLSPMVPFEPEGSPALTGTSVFIGAGRADPIVPAAQAERLAALLRLAGASVTLHWEPGGHTVSEGEIDAARKWIVQRVTSGRAPAA
jgi:predicted esterase/catechol 2,3-dioxygenase-like lactoylglutathione lyase family enzyme